MIVLHTSVLIDCLTGAKLSAPLPNQSPDRQGGVAGVGGDPSLTVGAPIEDSNSAIPFDTEQARISANLYRAVSPAS